MNKSGIFFAFVLFCVYLTLVFCDSTENKSKDSTAVQSSDSSDLFEEARVRRKHGFHGLHHLWGWHALAIAYFIKVKVVIVAFILGSAFFWGLRYFWPHKCHSEVVHEGPIVYDHPPSFSHHDHIPYSFDQSGPYGDHSFEATATFDTISSSDPYSAYTGAYSDTAPPTAAGTHRNKRSTVQRQHQYMATEEQIAEFMFTFLGLDSTGCRRRFICEMEFRSRLNPLTSMAFRIVGRGFFGKYTNARNTNGQANSFFECAAVNPECTVIEENFNEHDEQDHEVEEHEAEHAVPEATEFTENNASTSVINEVESAINSSGGDIKDNTVDDSTTQMERANAVNLWAERRGSSVQYRQRRRGSKLDVAAGILSRSATKAY